MAKKFIDADLAPIYLNSAACEQIKYMPAADVQEVRHGRWINNIIWYRNFGQIFTKCSVCGFEIVGDPTSRKNGMGGKYCENCGARMDGEENDKC